MGNYIRTHRKRAGLSQCELGHLLGYPSKAAVARHERSSRLPPLLIALAYEVVFDTPVSEIFAGLHETVQLAVKNRLVELEGRLHETKGGLRAVEVAQKLAWLNQRRSSSQR